MTLWCTYKYIHLDMTNESRLWTFWESLFYFFQSAQNPQYWWIHLHVQHLAQWKDSGKLIKLRTSFLPFFTSDAHVLLNRVAKLGLLGAFDDPGRLGVNDGAVKQSWKTEGFPTPSGKEYFIISLKMHAVPDTWLSSHANSIFWNMFQIWWENWCWMPLLACQTEQLQLTLMFQTFSTIHGMQCTQPHTILTFASGNNSSRRRPTVGKSL